MRTAAGQSMGRALGVLALSLALGACSSLKGPGSQGQKLDPWENWNRKVYGFNESLDSHVLKPVATTYSEIVPSPARTAVDNFFNNVGDAWSAINLMLQGRFRQSTQQVMRFAINSTFGIAGLIDIAGEAGLERNSQDLGQTFGRWGFGTGAYVVWPLFGPSSVRDSLALPWDRMASPALFFSDTWTRVGVYTLQTVNARSNFLRAGEMLDDIALDKYTFIRDAYLQRRGSFETDDDADTPEAPTPAASAAQP